MPINVRNRLRRGGGYSKQVAGGSQESVGGPDRMYREVKLKISLIRADHLFGRGGGKPKQIGFKNKYNKQLFDRFLNFISK